METILLIKRKLFKDAIIKEKFKKAVCTKDIGRINNNLRRLECIEPKKIVKFLEEILKDLINENEQYEAQIDMVGTLNESIEILKKDCENKIDKIKELEHKYKSILPAFSNKKERINKNDKIIDILKKALYKFKECKSPYPEVLVKLFKYINNRDIDNLMKAREKIKNYAKKDIMYIEEQINRSYTMSNLIEEIKYLKEVKNDTNIDKRLSLDLKVLRIIREICPLQKHEIKKSVKLNKQYECI